MESTNPLIYLASPYSRYYKGREEAYIEVCKKAAALMHNGYNVFCPIAHSHPIEKFGMDRLQDGEFWLKQDFSVLAHCDELWIYKMPGWHDSYGINKEIQFANNNDIPIKFLDYVV